MKDVLQKINSSAPFLEEEDVNDEMISNLAEFYQSRIDSHASRVYGGNLADVSRLAFRETSKDRLKNGLMTFLFKTELWRENRDLNSYLLTCLKRHAQQVQNDLENAKRTNVLICPGCRELGERTYLFAEDKLLRCNNCTSESDRILKELKKKDLDQKTADSLRTRISLHRLFALHSRKGFRCPEVTCGRFIPESLNTKYGILCPYTECDFFGAIDKLETMTHPTGASIRRMVSLNDHGSAHGQHQDHNPSSLQDLFEADNVSADIQISVHEDFKHNYDVLMSVINGQITRVERMNNFGSFKNKLHMYYAFREMTEKYPEDMVNYLCFLRQNSDFPIQSTIFQKFVEITENALPFTIPRDGEEVEIFSVVDPELGIFKDGISTFDAEVDQNHLIPNKTIETYTGSRQLRCFGPCFIGLINDVIDKKTGLSLKKKIKRYSFVSIEIDCPVGIEVTVTHYRIPSHYEMGSLVALQRIRRSIVDRLYFMLHGSKRRVGKSSVA